MFEEAVSTLLPLRHHVGAIGGSKAQQDFLHLTLIDAALRLQDQVRVDFACPILEIGVCVSGSGPVRENSIAFLRYYAIAFRRLCMCMSLPLHGKIIFRKHVVTRRTL